MKKSKLLVLGLIALMLAGGLVLASCEITPNCDGSCGRAEEKCSNPQGYKCGYSSTTCNCG